MSRVGCFCGLLTSKNKRNGKDHGGSVINYGRKKGHQASQLSLAGFVGRRSSEKDARESALDKVVPLGSHEWSPLCAGSGLDAAACGGGEERDEMMLPATRDDPSDHLDIQLARDVDAILDTTMRSGHLSDPGTMGRSTAFLGSPALKRSCSNIERRIAARPLLPPKRWSSCDDLQCLEVARRKEVSFGVAGGSPLSALSSCSADKVMLKKRSSSQVLPSRSRKLWWKLFLWSHRNLHMPRASRPAVAFPAKNGSNPKCGYSSDTLDRSNSRGESRARTDQWVAFAAEAATTPTERVDAWVNSIHNDRIDSGGDDDDDDVPTAGDLAFRQSFEVGESSSSSGNHRDPRTAKRLREEALKANYIVRSLNYVSAVAHISGMGLKVIPAISAFSGLRAVNLSGNSIAHITPGALPRSLHTLDLSRNKIAAIDGLRELTRLRVLNLSYNRISRIGHGLSGCTIVKELYLAGNKIGNVEGLHRLLKLAVVDLSFNKIGTAKALGQLVANYHSLQALNLLGNPIQGNVGDEQLRKAVGGLLPHLVYLNKQAIKPSNAREAVADRVARAALSDYGWNPRRRRARRVGEGSGSSVGGGGGGSGRHRSSRRRHRHDSPGGSRRMR